MTFWFFIGGAVVLGGVLAYFTWQDVTLMENQDCPEHVARRDWSKASTRRER